MPREGESGTGSPGSGRDRRRLGLGLLFMALLLATTLAAVFLWGRPTASGDVAPGVPVLVVSGWILVAGAAAVFYRTFPEDPGDPPDGRAREASRGEPRGASDPSGVEA
ncbi:MAG: hypothetical protein ABEJ46_05125 [Gemmatimonadota bacterium]